MEKMNATNTATVNALVHEIMSIRAKKKELASMESALVQKLYDVGVIDNTFAKQVVEVGDVIITKSPSMKSPRYDVDKVRHLADSLGLSRKTLVARKWVFSANEKALADLVKQGTVPQEVIDNMKVQYNKVLFAPNK